MEDPGHWNLLTGAIARCKLEDAPRSFARLVAAGMLIDGPQHVSTFTEIVSKVLAEGVITGPSFAHRISVRIPSAMCSATAADPDPHGRRAHQLLA